MGHVGDDFIDTFKIMVSNEFMRHNYLLSGFMNEERTSEVNSYYIKNQILNLRPIFLQGRLSFISEMLFKHF